MNSSRLPQCIRYPTLVYNSIHRKSTFYERKLLSHNRFIQHEHPCEISYWKSYLRKCYQRTILNIVNNIFAYCIHIGMFQQSIRWMWESESWMIPMNVSRKIARYDTIKFNDFSLFHSVFDPPYSRSKQQLNISINLGFVRNILWIA